MKLNLESSNGKLKVGIGNKDEHPIQVTMSREAFAKLAISCITGKRPEGDVRDFTAEMWQEFDLGK